MNKFTRALVNNPTVIIADEPTGDLDTENAETILNLLNDINENQEKTIVIVTHDESLITEKMRVIHIDDGKILNLQNDNNLDIGFNNPIIPES